MLHRILLAILISLPAAGWAVSANEVAELSRAGFSDETIIAKIEADGERYHLSSQKLIALKDEGVSEAVLRAMLDAGREPAALSRPEAPPSLAERRAEWRTETQPLLVPVYPPPYTYQPPRISYQVGPNPPMFVHGSPGVYTAPRPHRPHHHGQRPHIVIHGQSGTTSGTVIVRTHGAEGE